MNSLVRTAPLPLTLLLLVLGATPMAASAKTVTGTAAYRERIALPPDAVLEVSLEDVSRADAPADLIARTTVDPAGQVPIPFSIPTIRRHRSEPPLLGPRSHHPAGRAPLHVDDELPGADEWRRERGRRRAPEGGPAAAPDRALGETYWKLTRLGETAVRGAANQREASLVVHSGKGQVAGSGGCNRFSGSCTVEGSTLTFGNLALTRMACAEGMDQETAFLAALGKVLAWRISGDRLDLLDAGGGSLASFQAVDLK